MTITTTNTKDVFAGDGTSNQEFTWTFDSADLAQTEIRVREIDTSDFSVAPVTKTLTTHYTVDIALKKITATGSWTPSADMEIHVERNTLRTQATDQPTSGAFSSDSADEAHDRGVMLIQEALDPRNLRTYPVWGSGTTVLSTSSQAIFTSPAIDAPSGRDGTIVAVLSSVPFLNNASVDSDATITTALYAGPLGTVSDPISVLALRTAPVLQSHTSGHVTSVSALRVDDGDFITLGAFRSGSSGTVTSVDANAVMQIIPVDSY